jgi:DNA polymerase
MRTLVLDFETYYSKEYTLRTLTPVEYILDARFETILCAVKEVGRSADTQSPYIVDGEEFDDWVRNAGLEEACVVSHNALFDMCILALRYNIRPKLMVDTLGVSRALLGHRLKRLNLGVVAEYLRLGLKGTEIHNVIGMRRNDIKHTGRWPAFSNYSITDALLCEGIYDRLVRSGCFPVREMLVMDMVLRCATEPQFLLDQQMIATHLAEVQQKKLEMLASAMLVGAYNGKSDLMSNEKFADVLRSVGVDPPTKISPLTGRLAYAFAKTDKEFIALAEHPDAAVQVLVEARLGHKSTLEETRSERMLKIANLTWPGNVQRRMPIPLGYGRAHTHRLGGEWKLNMQNLPRGGKLRGALIAPDGYKVVVVDASQIEARIVAWICKQHDLVKDFADGIDVYAKFASDLFHRPVTDKKSSERFMGKTAILGLGYQVGATKFQNTIEVQSQLQLGRKIEMTLEQADDVVQFYRNKYQNIPKMWRRLQYNGIPVLAGNGNGLQIGPCIFEKEAILLPSGLRLNYFGLCQGYTEETTDEWTFSYGDERKKLYGGKILENIVQALARIHTMDVALRIQRYVKLALQAHDELAYVVPDWRVKEVKRYIKEEMCVPPDWAPDLPLMADVGAGQSYGECK